WFELDLGRVHQLAQVTLESGSFPADGPAGLRVETSPDGRVWDIAAQAAELLTGMHWWKGHPRVDDSGRVIVRMQPRPARFVRLIQTGSDHPGVLWSLAEIFAYEPAETAERPAPEAAAAYETAVRELAHWMDDPWGPHPKRTPASYERRKAQVPWAAVLEAVSQALGRAPGGGGAQPLDARTRQRGRW